MCEKNRAKIKWYSFWLLIVLSGCSTREGNSQMVVKNKKNSIQLPVPKTNGALSVEQAIAQRRSIRQYKQLPLSIDTIAQLLWAAQGITHDTLKRAVPSAAVPDGGPLYPLELYLVAKNITGLAAGVYHYIVQKHALEQCVSEDVSACLSSQPCVMQAMASIVICGDYERIGRAYPEQAQRYTHMEVGMAAENLYLQSQALNVGTVFVGHFDEKAVHALLALPAKEQPLCIMPLGLIE
jgi:SagB-type dehydrogenase family enzyme